MSDTSEATGHTGQQAGQAGQAIGGGCCGGSRGGCGCGSSSAAPAMKLNEIPLADMERLGRAELLSRFNVGIEWLDARVFQLPDEQVDQAFLPDAECGRWSIRALVTHLADAEMTLLMRMRMAVAQDQPMLAIFDEDAFIASELYGPGANAQSKMRPPVAGSVAVVHTLRRWALDWLGDLTESQLERAAMHPERGPLTVRQILAYDVWHLEHHVAIGNRKIARCLGE